MEALFCIQARHSVKEMLRLNAGRLLNTLSGSSYRGRLVVQVLNIDFLGRTLTGPL